MGCGGRVGGNGTTRYFVWTKCQQLNLLDNGASFWISGVTR